MAEKKWIKGAMKKSGAMTKAADREGVSNAEYVSEHLHDGKKSGARARLAKTLGKMRKNRYGKE